jgi:hypothetical protein
MVVTAGVSGVVIPDHWLCKVLDAAGTECYKGKNGILDIMKTVK